MSDRSRLVSEVRHTAEPIATASSVGPDRFPSIARFRFHLNALDPIRLPAYAGSAWRGLIGHGLRRTACVARQPTCAGCLLVQHCVYSTLFETPAPADAAARGYTALPHPFLLAIDPTAPRDVSPGSTFSLTIHLIGPAIAQAPYLIHALGVAGQRGFGRSGGRFMLASVEREGRLGIDDWSMVYAADTGVYEPGERESTRPPPASAELQLRLVTPLRIKRDGHFVGARDLTALDIVHALYRRLRSLAASYGGDPERFDPRSLPRDPGALQLHVNWLHWHEWTRYSSRQDTLMQFGGLIGEIQLAGPALPDLWPALWFGQWAHVGKGTAFGLGGYRIVEPAVQAATEEEWKERKLAQPDSGESRVENADSWRPR
jgi:hypothetical protein